MKIQNPVSIIGKTFEKVQTHVGTNLETILGGDSLNRSGSDFDFWELKSHQSDSTSLNTLASATLKNFDLDTFINRAFEKCENIVLVDYTNNSDNTFTVNSIIIMWGLNKELFRSEIGKSIKLENRGKRGINLRISKKNLIKLFGKKVIVY